MSAFHAPLQSVVEAWRAREEKETAAIVLTDRDLQRVLAAWPMAPRATLVADLPSDAGWPALWQAVQIDLPALYDMTGLPSGRAVVAWRRAVALRLVYPDGTIHRVARIVLQKLLQDAIQGGSRK